MTHLQKQLLSIPRRWQLVFLFQQLLQIFYEANHDHNGRPCHSDKEQRHNNSGNNMNHKFHIRTQIEICTC